MNLFISIILATSVIAVFGSKYSTCVQSPGNSDFEQYSVTKAKWPGKEITYKAVRAPWGIKQYDWDVAIKAAFNMWSEVIPMTFKRVSSGYADIEITMVPIDGPNGQVAITYPPADNNDLINGDIHLDNSEFYYSSYRPTTNLAGIIRRQSAMVGPDSFIDIFRVMIHNVGHAIGMKDNNDRSSVMSMEYLNLNNKVLSTDDKAGIQSLYGVRNGPTITVPTTTTTTTTTTRRPPQTTTQEPAGGYDKCKDGKIDAITMGTDGEAYAFRGVHFFKLQPNIRNHVSTELIRDGWKGLPDFIDGAVYLDGSKRYQKAPRGVYFFKGFDVYRFVGRKLQRGYPKKIESMFPGIPHEIDSVFMLQGRMLFAKGRKCYEVEYPFRSSGGDCNSSGTMLEHSRAPRIDAAFHWNRYGRTYFFSGSQYYRLKNSYYDDPKYPKSTRKYFLGCR